MTNLSVRLSNDIVKECYRELLNLFILFLILLGYYDDDENSKFPYRYYSNFLIMMSHRNFKLTIAYWRRGRQRLQHRPIELWRES